MNKFLVLILLFISNSVLFAVPKSQMGASFSNISGMGLTYSHYLGSHFHVQVAGFPWKSTTDDPDRFDKYYNFGIEFQRDFYFDKSSRLFVLTGTSYWLLEKSTFTEFIENTRPKRDVNFRSNEIWNVGFGIGYEKTYFRRMSVSANLGINYQMSEVWTGDHLLDHNPSGKEWFGVGLGISIKYIIK